LSPLKHRSGIVAAIPRRSSDHLCVASVLVAGAVEPHAA
jgi:hypothetical protein